MLSLLIEGFPQLRQAENNIMVLRMQAPIYEKFNVDFLGW